MPILKNIKTIFHRARAKGGRRKKEDENEITRRIKFVRSPKNFQKSEILKCLSNKRRTLCQQLFFSSNNIKTPEFSRKIQSLGFSRATVRNI